MAAGPTAIITDILEVAQGIPGTVDFTVRVKFLFTPTDDDLPTEEHLVLNVPQSFSKQDVRSAAHASIVASVLAKGAVITSARIFGVDDLV